MFSQPEEKLWLVIKHYTGCIDEMPSIQIEGRRAIKLEKGTIIKMGRVRMRVRDIDYAEVVEPVKPNLKSPLKQAPSNSSNNSPTKKATSATKLKANQKGEMKGAPSTENPDANINEIIDPNEI